MTTPLVLLLAVSLHAGEFTIDEKDYAKTVQSKGEARSNQSLLLDWLVGTKTQIGAYKAPALCCRLAREMRQNATDGRSPEVAHEGLLQGTNNLILLLSSALCPEGPAVSPGGRMRVRQLSCASDEKDGLPATAVLPELPKNIRAWVQEQKAYEAAVKEYSDEADKLDPLWQGKKKDAFSMGKLEKYRAAVFDAAFKLVLTDEALKKQLTELLGVDPSTLKTEDFYTKARAKVDAVK